MAESTARIGEIEICYETFGDASRPAVLLIMGLGTQMVAWHEDFCAQLADRGFFVIRHDNRDIGRSTHLDQLPTSRSPGGSLWYPTTSKVRIAQGPWTGKE